MENFKEDKKSIDTVIEDVYNLLSGTLKSNGDVENKKKVEVPDEYLTAFKENIGNIVKQRVEEAHQERVSGLRLSKIGTRNRKLWYEMNRPEKVKESQPSPQTLLKFLYGDLIEELLLFLIKVSGHTVEGEQGEIEIGGVLGHRDAKIDGITTDIKSTSKYAFPKFEKGTLLQGDDPFGYVPQISAYSKKDNSPFGAFIAMNKETGELALLKVGEIDMINPEARIEEIKDVLASSSPPEEKCYQPIPQNPKAPNGNEVLHFSCTYCPFKEECWSDANGGEGLRKFLYKKGSKKEITYFTRVEKTPRVEEIL